VVKYRAWPSAAQVLQFVLEAVRAESFNPATLFLFGSYTIGKERLFLEVARILQRKARAPACHACMHLSQK
jgi:DNA cross-link repair 1A protein